MANSKASIDKMRLSVMSILEGYTEDVETATKTAIDKTAKKTVKQLRNYRPNGAENYGRWDKYLKGWTSSEDKLAKYQYRRTIHNKTRYSLAHLLEKGHKDKNGKPHSRAYPHIEIAEDKAKNWFEEELEKEIKDI